MLTYLYANRNRACTLLTLGPSTGSSSSMAESNPIRLNTKAAKPLTRKRLGQQGRAPRVMITDKLRSYGAAKREIMPGVEHRSHKGLNNRAENSHQPTRRRDKIMKRFRSSAQTQRFVSIHDPSWLSLQGRLSATVKAGSANPKISACLGDLADRLGISKYPQLVQNSALILGHGHLYLPKSI